MKKFFLFKLFTLFGLSIILLASCGAPKETPEEVIKQFKEQTTEIESGDVSAQIAMNGTDNQDVIDFTANLNIKFDYSNLKDRKADVKVSLGGMMKTSEQSLDGDIDLNMLTAGEDYYILLNKLESNSEDMASIKPIIDAYAGKWLHISDSFIPENIRQIQEKDEETLAKEKQLKQLFVDTNLFTIVKEYGIETIDGKKVYHYGVQFNESGIQEYIRKSAIINGRDLTEAEIQEASKVISYINNAELWIGTKDYYPYKATAYLTLKPAGQTADMNINITFNGTDYNRSIKINAPATSEEFNPIELLMAYSTLSMEEDEAVEVSESGDLAEDEMMQIFEGLEESETE